MDAEQRPSRGRLLYVGHGGGSEDTGSVVVTAGLVGLTGALLALYRPDAVACPLIARDFDASMVAQRLAALGYRGHLLVTARALPDPAGVAAELRRLAPDLTVEVIVLPSP